MSFSVSSAIFLASEVNSFITSVTILILRPINSEVSTLPSANMTLSSSIITSLEALMALITISFNLSKLGSIISSTGPVVLFFIAFTTLTTTTVKKKANKDISKAI